jgi:hypothetical protein
MDKERQLYDAFVDVLLRKVSNHEASPKELEIVMNFLKNNNIQATLKHQGLSNLANKATALPFDEEDDELPERTLKRVK